MVMGEIEVETEVVVVGGGPGGYAAAFRAADLGLGVTLVSDEERLGGTCLLRGCIPSKTLLSVAELRREIELAGPRGLRCAEVEVDGDRLRSFKEEVVDQLSGGLDALCDQRGVRRLQARARFVGSQELHLQGGDASGVKFEHAVVATGSRPIPLSGTPFSGRVMDSAAALRLDDVPETLLVVGGGYVGLEMGMVYASLGSRVTVVEESDRLMSQTDGDLVAPLAERAEQLFESILLERRVRRLEPTEDGVQVELDEDEDDVAQTYDRVLVAVGRMPNTGDLGLESTGAKVDDEGFVVVDEKRRSGDPHIFAVGDVTGGRLLAHEAMREARVAAEVIAGRPAAFDARAVPAVIYTDPQIAWCGLSEEQAQSQGRDVTVERFPWRASGRALSMGRGDGLTKLVLDPETERVLGVGIVGPHAESLIAEGALAVEMGAVARDLALTVHPHPSLSETVMQAAQLALGGATDLPPTKTR